MTDIREQILIMLREILRHPDYNYTRVAKRLGFRSKSSIAEFISGKHQTMKMDQATAVFDLHQEIKKFGNANEENSKVA